MTFPKENLVFVYTTCFSINDSGINSRSIELGAVHQTSTGYPNHTLHGCSIHFEAAAIQKALDSDDPRL